MSQQVYFHFESIHSSGFNICPGNGSRLYCHCVLDAHDSYLDQHLQGHPLAWHMSLPMPYVQAFSANRSSLENVTIGPRRYHDTNGSRSGYRFPQRYWDTNGSRSGYRFPQRYWDTNGSRSGQRFSQRYRDTIDSRSGHRFSRRYRDTNGSRSGHRFPQRYHARNYNRSGHRFPQRYHDTTGSRSGYRFPQRYWDTNSRSGHRFSQRYRDTNGSRSGHRFPQRYHDRNDNRSGHRFPQRYHDTTGNRSGHRFPHHPRQHHDFHQQVQPAQVIRGHSINIHPPVTAPSYRPPTNPSHGSSVLIYDAFEMGARHPGSAPSTSAHIPQSHRGGNMHQMITLTRQNLPPAVFSPDNDVALPVNHHTDMHLDTEDMSYEDLLELGEQIGNAKSGLSEKTITSEMMTKTYRLPTDASEEEETDLCVICQDEYKNKENLGILRCGHEYHADCLRKWLLEKNVCPMCKSVALIPGEEQ